jgi:hypothetical protein
VPGKLTLDLGGVKVQIWHPAPATRAATPSPGLKRRRCCSPATWSNTNAGVYTGDAHLQEWPATLEALRALKAEAIVPGRGEAMKGAANVNKALDYTKRWVETLYKAGKEAAAAEHGPQGRDGPHAQVMDPVFGQVFIYEHCLPFDVSRAFDEASGIKNPRIWTAERDKEMWAALQG